MKRVLLKRREIPVKPPDEDFTGLLEDWDDRVFMHADHFRLHRFHGNGEHDRAETPDFAHAMVMAVDALKEHKRVIVYAITATGRYQALVPKRWGHYATLWLAKVEKSKRA